MDEAGLGLEFGLGHHEGPGLADALQIGTRRVLIESRLMGGDKEAAHFLEVSLGCLRGAAIPDWRYDFVR